MFYLADILETQNAENKVLVAEVDGEIVGVMCLTTAGLDLEALEQSCFLDEVDHFAKINGEGDAQSNVFRITLFFLKEEYESCASDFLLVSLNT